MKNLRKILAGALAFVLIFTGLYFVSMDESKVEAATEKTTDTNKDMLDVKVQLSTDGKVMRFISSVDSLDYARVGFSVKKVGETTAKTYTTKTVYEAIESTTEGVEYTFSPKAVDISSKYFVTAKMNVEEGAEYIVKAFVISQDGETTTNGMSRCVAAEDEATGTGSTLNLAFASTANVTEGTLNVSYGSGKTTTAEVIGSDGSTVWVRVNVDKATLPSLTKFTFSGAASGTASYRNLYTSHVPATGTTPVADTTWYTENDNTTEYVVATGADLYGIAELANKTSGYETFAGKTIYLISDIDLQPNGKDILWTPIGYMSSAAPRDITAFKGTFDGQMHKISNMKSASNSKSKHGGASWYLGFFGAASGATIKNFELIGGSVTGAYNSGAVAGYAANTRFENVHANVTVNMANGQVGGLIGNSEAVTLISCWNEGAVTAGANDYAGGLIGISAGATIDGCLNTGTVKTGKETAGGFVGRSTGALTISDSISTGTITYANVKRAGLGIGEQNGTAAELLNWNEKSVIVISNGSTLKPLGLNYGQVIVSNTGASLNATTCMTSVADSSAISGLSGYTATQLTFDRPETPDVQEGYWVVGTGIPELKCFSSSNNEELKGQFRKDTRWASVVEVETIGGTEVNTYKIKTAEEFLGFASLVNAGTRDFAGEVVYLENDIAFNTASKEIAEEWAAGIGIDDIYKGYVSVGYRKSSTDDKRFAGTFDGKMHTISGIYSVATYGNGLFAYTSGATLKNFSLKDSYIQGGEGTGSIVGWYANGTFDTIYSNAIVKGYASASKNHGGGLFALMATNATATKCWFDGEVTGAKYVGGITSYNQAGVVLTDCFNTGVVTSTITKNENSNYSYVGGIVGYAAANITLVNCVEAGSVTGYGYTGTAIGKFDSGKTVTITKCYFEALSNHNIIGGASGTLMVDGANITATSGATITKNNPATKITNVSTMYGANAYTTMSNLSFERTDVTPATTGAWVIREGNIPALKSFVK